MKDAITALKFVNQITSAFGGNNEVTIGGQSAGATMIRGRHFSLKACNAQKAFH